MPGPDGGEERGRRDAAGNEHGHDQQAEQERRLDSAQGAEEGEERQAGEGQGTDLDDAADQLAGDDVDRGQVGRQEVLQGPARFLLGDGAGDEGRGDQGQQDEVLRDEHLDEVPADEERVLLVDGPPRPGEQVEEGEPAELQDQPTGVDPAEVVVAAAAAAEEQFVVE